MKLRMQQGKEPDCTGSFLSELTFPGITQACNGKQAEYGRVRVICYLSARAYQQMLIASPCVLILVWSSSLHLSHRLYPFSISRKSSCCYRIQTSKRRRRRVYHKSRKALISSECDFNCKGTNEDACEYEGANAGYGQINSATFTSASTAGHNPGSAIVALDSFSMSRRNACTFIPKFLTQLCSLTYICASWTKQVGDTPLHLAAGMGQLKTCRALIEREASVNKPNRVSALCMEQDNFMLL